MALSPVAAALVLVCATLFFWRDGVSHLVGVWGSSAFYTYNYMVLPVAAALMWLGWREGETFAPWTLGFAAIPISALIYAAGVLTDTRLLQHTGIACVLISVIACCFGRSFSIRHRFALVFMLFMIPIGDGLLPFLQVLTVKGIMVVTGFVGVPAIQDGTMIRTDAGDFLVIEACAGLKLLMATIVSGAAFSHLVFTNRTKQIVFMIACITVPIFANILRASGTVLIGTATNMEIGAHGGHIFYGWVLFVIVLGILFGIGYLWADKDAPRRPNPQKALATNVPMWLLPAALVPIVVAGMI